MQVHKPDDDDDPEPRMAMGQPDGNLDVVEVAPEQTLSLSIDGELPIYRDGFDWTTAVGDQRITAFGGKEVFGRRDGDVIAQGQVTQVYRVPNHDGLLVDVTAFPGGEMEVTEV